MSITITNSGGRPIRRRDFLVAGAAVFGAGAWARQVAHTAYHDATPAHHQQQQGVMRKEGFRPIAVSVYRNPQLRYAAVWRRMSGPDWRPFHGLSAAQFQTFFDTSFAQGYRPTMLTVTGGGSVGGKTLDDVYAGVVERDNTPSAVRSGLDSKSFREFCASARNDQMVLRWASVYGGRERLYAGIWERRPGVIWDFKITTAIDGSEIGMPLTLPENPELRVSFVTRSPFGEYLAVYRSDHPSAQLERHGMTSSQYQTQYSALTSQGYVPTCVQAGGDPRVGEARFVALFAKARGGRG